MSNLQDIEQQESEPNLENLSYEEKMNLADIEKNLGNNEFKANNIEKAIFHYSKSLDLNPVLTSSYCNRSQAYYKIKNYKNGLEDAIKAVNLEPNNTKALYRRYSGLLNTNRIPEAIFDLKTILSIEPENSIVQGDLEAANLQLLINQEKEYEELQNIKNYENNENVVENVIPLKEKKEDFSLTLTDLSNILRENLKSKDSKLYDETFKQLNVLYETYQNNENNDEGKEETLNNILILINDLHFFFSQNDDFKNEFSEIINKKKLYLNEIINYEFNKTDPDFSKALILINSLLKLHQTYVVEEEAKKPEIDSDIIELLKKRVKIHKTMNNLYFAKVDEDSIKKMQKEDINKKPVDDNESKKKNSLNFASQVKEKGADHFNNKRYKEAYNCFYQAKKILEKEFLTEIGEKNPEVFDLYIKLSRNEALTLHQMKEYFKVDEKLETLLKLIPDDKRTLEIRANNYMSIGTINGRSNYEGFLKAAEIYGKLIDHKDANNLEREGYRNELAKIQKEINKDSEYKKDVKLLEDFEKKVNTLTIDNLIKFLKEQNFEKLEKFYKFDPINSKTLITLINFACQDPKNDIEFKVQILKFLKNSCGAKFNFNLGFVDISEKEALKRFLDEAAQVETLKNIVSDLKISYKINN